MPLRVAVVVSADLAHTHMAWPPGPYGYSPDAEPFDTACGQWAATLDAAALLTKAASLVQHALSCGFTGLVMMHGMLQSGPPRLAARWQSTLLANYHPTYYGMMVSQVEAVA